MSDPHFVGVLVLEPDPTDTTNERLVVASDSFAFYDNHGVKWVADKGEVTDGASIPGLIKLFLGRSFREPYLPAATLHDIYCRSKTRSCAATADMFCQALITNGVDYVRAGAMWSAVRAFGPHW